MTELPAPLPPGWEAVVGWPAGEARWLSGFWTSLGDHPDLSDGRTSLSGDGYGWLAWARHPAVAPHLRPYRLGDSMAEGPHALLFDLAERRVFACVREEAERLVLGQWPVSEPVQLTAEQMDEMMRRLGEAMAARPLPTGEQLIAAMRRHSALVAAMIAWLDQRQAAQEERS